MRQEKVEVVVYDAPSPAAGSSCACGCGGHDHHDHDHGGAGGDPMAAVSLEMQTRALMMTLEAAFPGRVRVEYVNVLTDPRGPQLPQTALLSAGTYPSPLVYINGQGRFAGALVAERVREAVGQILEGA